MHLTNNLVAASVKVMIQTAGLQQPGFAAGRCLNEFQPQMLAVNCFLCLARAKIGTALLQKKKNRKHAKQLEHACPGAKG